jgi:hypothetical protein
LIRECRWGGLWRIKVLENYQFSLEEQQTFTRQIQPSALVVSIATISNKCMTTSRSITYTHPKCTFFFHLKAKQSARGKAMCSLYIVASLSMPHAAVQSSHIIQHCFILVLSGSYFWRETPVLDPIQAILFWLDRTFGPILNQVFHISRPPILGSFKKKKHLKQVQLETRSDSTYRCIAENWNVSSYQHKTTSIKWAPISTISIEKILSKQNIVSNPMKF